MNKSTKMQTKVTTDTGTRGGAQVPQLGYIEPYATSSRTEACLPCGTALVGARV
jgi:hypothetical protein